MHKKITSLVLLTFTVLACSAFAQNQDLQKIIHEVKNIGLLDPKNAYWGAVKQALAGYSPEEIVRALIAEVDVDRGDRVANNSRDVNAAAMIRVMNLPPTLICQELAKEQPPPRKASLMSMLRGTKSPEVTQALLRQIKDRRPDAAPSHMAEFVKVRGPRVCDVAINVLAYNLGVPDSRRGFLLFSDARRDEIMQQTLADLKLSIPD